MVSGTSHTTWKDCFKWGLITQGVQGSNGFYSTCLQDKFSLVSSNNFTWRATRMQSEDETMDHMIILIWLRFPPTNSARILVRQLAHPLLVTDYVWPIKKMVCRWWISADFLDSSEGLDRRVHIFTRWNDGNFSIKGESERNEVLGLLNVVCGNERVF